MREVLGQPSEGERPATELSGAEPVPAPVVSSLPPELLQEFGRWLDRWAGYTRARLAEQGLTGAINQQPPASPPASGPAAITKSPPAHWLALFSGQPGMPEPFSSQPPEDVIRQFEAELERFLGRPAPNIALTVSPEGLGKALPAEDVPLIEPQVRVLSPPVSPPAPFPMRPPEGVPIPATGLRMRTTAVPVPELKREAGQEPIPGQPVEIEQLQEASNNPAQPESASDRPRVTRLRLGRSSSHSPAQTMQYPTVDMPALPSAPSQRPQESEMVPLPFSIKPAPPAPPFPLEALDLPEPVPQGDPVQPVWPEPPRPLYAPPLRWASETSSANWPELPEARTQMDPGPRPYQNPERRRRIDREQGGGSWNG